ncbi:phosphatidylglycerophosphatase A [Amylibacter sp. IMCC11727]|uniref:phosphatidylglycerophosphatase A family protein n=1 Tax=Amylibacter sp. IMCC11727 TaxID=3039851 RepID=UPI00244DA360|nr:phosphatidylglycerophosphatase A [Amylibacter sp. IMCC11727]WGI20342.1 phosphatidylglycerophosphatase A [Amylibacter sp. IMCC11727]
MNKLIATWFYAGLLPKVPGTWGSAAALPFAVVLHALGGFPALLIGTIVVFFVGWWATAEVTRGQAEHDPGMVVIDEVAGQWITLMPLSYVLWSHGSSVTILPWPGLVGGFFLFRLFDILKPWPVSWADKKSTPFGVMFDDVLAGIMAAVVLSIGGYLAHGGFS